jgi:hypothetical protein
MSGERKENLERSVKQITLIAQNVFIMRMYFCALLVLAYVADWMMKIGYT